MNRLRQVFEGKKAFIPFITAGDPSIEITEQLVMQMAAAGADLIELGIPFSDPVAEGLVIQNASERALAGGVTVDSIFDMLMRVRKACDVPVAFMTYVNPVYAYGVERFLRNCHEVQVDAMIVPDLPFEERDELMPYCRKYGITLISMIAPTSGKRIQRIAREAEGFIYCVSSMGVTGMRDKISDDVKDMVRLVKEVSDIPCAIGFGISTPGQAARMAEFADGVIVGSAIVKIIEKYGSECVPHVVEYVRTMKNAVSRG